MGGCGAANSEQRSALALFGSHLRLLRTHAGLTQEECAARLGYSTQHLGNLETGRRMPPEAFAVAADRLLGGRKVLYGLWQLARDQVASAGAGAVEARATAIHTYQAHLVPELLRHGGYASAVVASARPPLPPERARARVSDLLARQRVLRRGDPPWLWAVVDEAVLHRELGGRDVTRAQLACLAEWAARHTVTVQVLPFSAASSPALGASFTLLSLDDGSDVVTHDLPGGEVGHDGASTTVARLRAVFDYLRESALSAADSLALIEQRLAYLHTAPRDDTAYTEGLAAAAP